jgi:hypothetical protein
MWTASGTIIAPEPVAPATEQPTTRPGRGKGGGGDQGTQPVQPDQPIQESPAAPNPWGNQGGNPWGSPWGSQGGNPWGSQGGRGGSDEDDDSGGSAGGRGGRDDDDDRRSRYRNEAEKETESTPPLRSRLARHVQGIKRQATATTPAAPAAPAAPPPPVTARIVASWQAPADGGVPGRRGKKVPSSSNATVYKDPKYMNRVSMHRVLPWVGSKREAPLLPKSAAPEPGKGCCANAVWFD